MSAGTTVHAGAALVGPHGVLIRGASGSGKSSLLMSLIFADGGATLVADDRVVLAADGGRLVATPPPAIAGLLEVRGAGIVRLPYAPSAAIDLVVDLLPLDRCPRIPDGDDARAVIDGVAVRRIFVAVGAHDGAARIRTTLAGGEL